MSENYPPSVPLNKLPAAALLLRSIADMDEASESSVDARAALLTDLAQRASASDDEQVSILARDLERAQLTSPSLSLAHQLFAGIVAIRRENYASAREHLFDGRSKALQLNRETEAAAFSIALGSADYRQGLYSDAQRHFEDAMVGARRAGSWQLEARAVMNLGLILKNTGDLRGAERLLRTSRDLAPAHSHDLDVARASLNLANLLVRRGLWLEAAASAASAIEVFDVHSLSGFSNSAHLAHARATRSLGDATSALRELEPSLEEARRIPKPRNVILALEFLGDCALDLGDPGAAKEHYQEALLLARSHGKATDLVLECSRGLGAAELACGELQSAEVLVRESIAIARGQGDSFELATSLIVLADVLLALNAFEDARAALEEARDLGVAIGADQVARQAKERLAAFASGTVAASAHSPERTPVVGPRPTRRPAVDPATGIKGFLSVDSRVLRAVATVKKLAPRRLNILIHGESGTGKELIAHAVHDESGRSGPFVPVNCSAFPGDLIEGELFGHARGAYTGADRERVGLFEFANKGTLFLDEIGDMPIKAQARLLRALESGEVRRLGENSARVVDVRVVAATHRDLMTMVGAGEFRLDLYYRLAGYVVELPPVRERPEDAKLLVDHFLERFAREQGKSLRMTADLRQQLAVHSWPGNVREIRLVMDRLVSLSEDGAEIHRLPFALEGDPRPRSLPELMEAEEKRRILDALQASNWNKQRAATTLGTNRTTLIGKMKRMGIATPKP